MCFPRKYDTIVAQTGHQTDLYLISLNVQYTLYVYNLKHEYIDCVRHRLLFGGLFKKRLVLHSARQKEKLWFSATSFDEEVKMILRDKDLKKIMPACTYASAKHILVFCFVFLSAFCKGNLFEAH